MEKRNFKQRVAIQFCVTLGDSATETHGKLLNVYGSDFMSRQSQHWLSPGASRPKKARMSKSKVKTKHICFFDSRGGGGFHKEFVPAGQTINLV